VFRTLETLARRLLELNVVDLTITHPPTVAAPPRARTASGTRLSSFNQEAWDAWFKQQILIALEDDSPGIDYREVSKEAQDRIRKIGGQHARPKKC